MNTEIVGYLQHAQTEYSRIVELHLDPLAEIVQHLNTLSYLEAMRIVLIETEGYGPVVARQFAKTEQDIRRQIRNLILLVQKGTF